MYIWNSYQDMIHVHPSCTIIKKKRVCSKYVWVYVFICGFSDMCHILKMININMAYSLQTNMIKQTAVYYRVQRWGEAGLHSHICWMHRNLQQIICSLMNTYILADVAVMKRHQQLNEIWIIFHSTSSRKSAKLFSRKLCQNAIYTLNT